eukprot:TRINITY_DN1770_c0_g1_i4.p2 TRINITY_DN1770_c0_g1~~TRINITY_DN1770_c0_g1_i4.p2  ORF type:complete len:1018 (-),score=360.70 TRINITY_DN1770_c0_g1_i4:247-3300(-)
MMLSVRSKISSTKRSFRTPYSSHQSLFTHVKPTNNKAANLQPRSCQRQQSTNVGAQNADYLEGLYVEWEKNPGTVDQSLGSFFSSLQNAASGATGTSGASLAGQPVSEDTLRSAVEDSLRVINFIRAYQVRGHMLADLDPLKLDSKPVPPETEITHYGWTEADLDKPIYIGSLGSIKSGFIKGGSTVTLRVLRDHLRRVYCGTIGLEYMHIQDRGRCNWIRERFENLDTSYSLNKEEKLRVLDRLLWADALEKFLARKYSSVKRFGLDGCESLVPGLKALIDEASRLGVDSIVMGMPHRGRINVLGNVLRKPLPVIFRDFNPSHRDVDDGFSGDVKYHLGTSYDRPTVHGKKIHISLLPNPSHLEAVDPVVMGKAKAKQFYMGGDETARGSVMPLLLHGDAAFSGQGVVYECFDMTNLPNYGVGGIVHVIVNNQIGFTTDPKAGRSWSYPTEVAKTVEAPIFHVNGDDPEAVVKCFKLAAEWRAAYRSSVVVDVVCYRRFGHNELDQPSFTQPLMYEKIGKHPHTIDIYSKRLIAEGVLTAEDFQKMKDSVHEKMNEGFEAAKTYQEKFEWLTSKWGGFNVKSRKQLSVIRDTTVPLPTLKEVGAAVTKIPEGFNAHPTLKKIIEARGKMIETGTVLDWAMGEFLAVGSLLTEGHHVRLSGQDVERGTFSHRHAVWHDQKTNFKYVPLNAISSNQAKYTVCNSSLSEFGVLGFEFGYSLESPNQLIMWEAQFGDFANGAQVIMDQFFAACEAKWKNQCGLVLLLPHGYEGQGAEHSSAKLERFLQLHDSDPTHIPEMGENTKQIQESNFQVAYCTTPANYFHLLRRQIHRDFRKPLVVMSPKSLLKHRLAVSDLSEFALGGAQNRFLRVIGETSPQMVGPNEVRKAVFCSGKVYYDLLENREKRNVKDIVLIRVEQIAPFPFDLILDELKRYPNAEVVWAQEEPMNMGAWSFVAPHFKTSVLSILAEKGVKPQQQHEHPWGCGDIKYIGRDPAASPATGFHSVHVTETNTMMDQVFG